MMEKIENTLCVLLALFICYIFAWYVVWVNQGDITASGLGYAFFFKMDIILHMFMSAISRIF